MNIYLFITGCVCLILGLVIPEVRRDGSGPKKYVDYYGWAYLAIAAECFFLSWW